MRRILLTTPVFLIFFVITLITPIYWLVTDNQEDIFLTEENRAASTFPGAEIKEILRGFRDGVRGDSSRDQSIVFGQLIDTSLQRKVESWANDRFPFRLLAIKVSKLLDRTLINTTYVLLKDPAIPADTQSGYYIMRDDSMMFGPPKIFDDVSKKVIEDGVEHYKVLMQQSPGVTFYTFYIQRIEDSPYHPLNQYFVKSDQGQGITYFEEIKPQKLIFAGVKFQNYQDQVDYSFRTDHHWNIRGACMGYEAVYDLLKQNYPEIPPLRNCDQFYTLKDVEFLGAYARETLYPVKPDVFEIVQPDLPFHQILLDGKETQPSKVDQYLRGDFSRKPYVNHYARVYGSLAEDLVYYFPDNPPRDLLFIGASYRKPIEALIASHYRYTYIIDPRYQENFSLAAFLQEHPVDDLLILGHDSTIYGYDHWYINP